MNVQIKDGKLQVGDIKMPPDYSTAIALMSKAIDSLKKEGPDAKKLSDKISKIRQEAISLRNKS